MFPKITGCFIFLNKNLKITQLPILLKLKNLSPFI